MRTYISRLSLPALLLGLVLISSCGREEPTVAPPPPVIPGEVVMNEIYSRGVPGNLDWVEIYNPSSAPISIGGYLIYDAGGQGGTKPKKAIPAGAVVLAKGFYVVVTDTNTSATILDGFGLSSAGEQIWLENAGGTLVDTYTFLAMSETQTWGRLPDGEANWQLLNTITRGAVNKQ
jgi:hypothetical protein